MRYLHFQFVLLKFVKQTIIISLEFKNKGNHVTKKFEVGKNINLKSIRIYKVTRKRKEMSTSHLGSRFAQRNRWRSLPQALRNQ